MEQRSFDDRRPDREPRLPNPRQIPSEQQVEPRVVTEVDASHEFPISRVRWRPRVVTTKD